MSDCSIESTNKWNDGRTESGMEVFDVRHNEIRIHLPN